MRLLRALAFAVLVLLGRRRRDAEPRILAPPADDAVAGGAVLALVAASSLCSIGFILAYVFDMSTQVLGIALSGALGGLAAAAIVAGKGLVPQEELEEELESHVHERERRESAQIIREAGEGVSRRRLMLTAAAGGAGLCGAALALPAASLGPVLETGRLLETPWRRGRRLVDEKGRRWRPEDIEVGGFVTAFPEDTTIEEKRRIDAPLMVVRVRPEELRLPAARADWHVDGIVAYSKICTHAACAVSEFDYPLWDEASPRPRLVCPCHYSTFDAVGGGEVVFGPAGRPLPQLPLAVSDDGSLMAAGGYSGAPGPSWRSVRG
jgi:ubiquinol-cytochrome c reductase iron-sulfur subunit